MERDEDLEWKKAKPYAIALTVLMIFALGLVLTLTKVETPWLDNFMERFNDKANTFMVENNIPDMSQMYIHWNIDTVNKIVNVNGVTYKFDSLKVKNFKDAAVVIKSSEDKAQ